MTKLLELLRWRWLSKRSAFF